jgi:ComF family protein
MVCQNILEIEGRQWFCEHCEDLVEAIEGPVCQKCGCHIAEETAMFCPECKASFSVRKVERNYSFMVYDDIAKGLIHGFKYRGYKEYGAGLIEIISMKMNLDFIKNFDLLIPVPLHDERLKERGFNQAEVLARQLFEKIGVPVATDLLLRTRATAKQSLLGPGARESNISGAFSATNAEKSNGMRLLLIDDIYTTGSTLSECASVLLAAGAQSVCSFTVCKTIKKDDDKEN